MAENRRERRRERRRAARGEQRIRVERLAATTAAPSEPLVRGATWRARTAAVVAALLFVVTVERPAGAGLAHPRPGDLFFAVWTSLFVAWLLCRLALWRVVADREGIHLRGLWSVRSLPWAAIGRVELRGDGRLDLISREPVAPAGCFAPLWLTRVVRAPGIGGPTADMLTAMAGHGGLRPTAGAGRRERGRGYVRWVIPLAAVLHVATVLAG
ncbi:PH domain-containing protein [Streptomyces sp. NPDC020141]|uniref:PH domain-containing protein n=1 Tax=Streptomyces sp. NPDC020141 TaxID=3365065 RepID=UPI0037BDA2FD